MSGHKVTLRVLVSGYTILCIRYVCQALPYYGGRRVSESTHDVSKRAAMRHLLTSGAGPGYKPVSDLCAACFTSGF